MSGRKAANYLWQQRSYEFFVEKDSIGGKHDRNDCRALQVKHYTTKMSELSGKCCCRNKVMTKEAIVGIKSK